MTRQELLVGTRKGLVVLRGARGGAFETAARVPGEVVEFATRDPRTGRYFAGVTHGQFGPHLFYSDDPAGKWHQAEGLGLPRRLQRGGRAHLGDRARRRRRRAVVRRGAGGAVPQRRRRQDLGTPSRRCGMCPSGRTGTRAPAASACTRSVRGPATPNAWRSAYRPAASGSPTTAGRAGGAASKAWCRAISPRRPARTRTRYCVHSIKRAPRQPSTIYMQFHGGVYRSDDAGESWIDIGTDSGLPSDFGFPLAMIPPTTRTARSSSRWSRTSTA